MIDVGLGWCWSRWWAAGVQVATMLSSSIPVAIAHSAPLPLVAGVGTGSGTPGRSFGGCGIGGPVSVYDAESGSRLGEVFCSCRVTVATFATMPAVTGARSSQCAYGERTQELACRPAGTGAQGCGCVTECYINCCWLGWQRWLCGRQQDGAPLYAGRLSLLFNAYHGAARSSTSGCSLSPRGRHETSPQTLHNCRFWRVAWCDGSALHDGP